MRSDLTDITVVLDRSGSMSISRNGAEEGLNAFIKQQQQQPGTAVFTLVQFDDRYEVVHRAIPIADVPPCTLVPRGMTALLDALGKIITDTGIRLAAVPEEDRPGLVTFVVITDGQENASKEFTKQQIKEMIEHQQTVYNWQFTYLGANQDAFAEASKLGFANDTVADYSVANTKGTFMAASANVGRMRGSTLTGQHVNNSYTTQERLDIQ